MANVFGVPHQSSVPQTEQNIQLLQNNMYVENLMHLMLNGPQQSPSMTIFDTPTSFVHRNDHIYMDSFVDLNRVESSYLCPNESEIGGRNHFTNIMQRVPLDVNSAQSEHTSVEPRLFSPEDQMLNTSSQSSVAAPLLEMGFSMQHVRTINTTGTNTEI